MPVSVPRMIGLWFVVKNVLCVGSKSKNSSYRLRAVILSLLVMNFTRASFSRSFSDVSLIATRRRPFRRASSGVAPPGVLRSSSRAASAAIA
jgi:hypothetical protein